MKHLITVIIILFLYLSVLYAQTDIYPKLIVAELVTASWCTDSPEAYDAMNEVRSVYSYGEVVFVRYYTSDDGGQYSAPEIDNIIDGYEVSDFPTYIVNGKERISGMRFPVSDGLPYKALIEKEYYSPSPVMIDIQSFDLSSGNIDIKITMVSETESLNNSTVRFILIEDGISNGVTNVARTVEQETVSLSGQNSSLNLEKTFSINPSWNQDNLYALVYVDNSEGEIIQAASTYPDPETNIRAVIPNQRMDVGPSSGLFEVDYFSLFNLGSQIDLTINVGVDEAPDTWSVSYCDEEGLCYLGPYDFTLNQGNYRRFHANVMPNDPGMMDYSFRVQSASLSEDYIIPFRYITQDVSLLVVDGDGWSDYEEFTTEILDDHDYSYGVWDAIYADVSSIIMPHIDTIAWITGNREPALSLSDRAFLRAYLDSGNRLFISGQNLGKHLVNHTLYADPEFYSQYLNAELVAGNTDLRLVNGVEGDIVSDGLTFLIQDGDGADNQYSPEVINAFRGYSVPFLSYQQRDESYAGIRSIHSGTTTRTVYLAFGFEAINNQADRANLLINAINWFSTTNVDDNTLPDGDYSFKLLPSYPNPFSLQSSDSGSRSASYVVIPFYLPNGRLADDMTITIRNIKGQLIKTLTNFELQDGKYGTFRWDGRNEMNKPVASGIYFYTLKNNNLSQVKKMLILH